MAAVFYDILDAVVTRIQSLSLTGIADASIVLRKTPWDRDITKPAVIVSPFQERRNHLAGSNELDQTEYGVLVTVYNDSNQNLTSDFETHLTWRQQITRAFENQVAIDTVEEVLACSVDPGPMLTKPEFLSGYDVSSLIVRVTAREGRT